MRIYFVIGFLLGTYLLLGFLLDGGVVSWSVLAGLYLALSMFIVARLFPERFSHLWVERVTHASFLAMGTLSFIFVFALARGLIWLALNLVDSEAAGSSPSALLSNAMIGALSLVVYFGGALWAGAGPRIKRVHVTHGRLPEGLHGLRLLQISDLHIGTTIRKTYVERMVMKANELKADFIFFTGDIGDGEVSRFREDIEPLKSLQAKHGAYYVLGNHEYYWNADEWIAEMKVSGIQTLLNQSARVAVGNERVLIAGITDPAAPMARGHSTPDVKAALAEALEEDFKILLSHRPDFADEASALGVDLQLSGHTHAGQFFPWTWVVRMVHKYAHGLYQVDQMWIYVSAGTGSWGPRLRLGTTPELTVIELKSPTGM